MKLKATAEFNITVPAGETLKSVLANSNNEYLTYSTPANKVMKWVLLVDGTQEDI